MDKKSLKATRDGKVLGVPLNGEELKRLLAQKPKHVRYDAAWGRQLILERLAQLEEAKRGNGATA